MGKIWVVNASPVITLAKAGYLDLLTALASEVLLPDAVVSEILAGPATDPARQAVEVGWGKRVSIGNVPATLLEWSLGAGETAVLAVALERGDCTAVLDDAEGRMCARTLGIPVLGTLGVVLRAKKRGLVASAAQVMQALQAAGLYLDNKILSLVLQQTGEKWNP